ncbi:hypothetical protein KDH_59290 [Dictyobacter sp. S3.2.2.5]|uniref:Uncharacterized protein n=1 Tax=Dictyobacter halimunensis TaxID=3026934 RepID=A0ABQ6FZB1_9CHLR|nr:hypothetical protein KDH_59290 [Dictyobacter sp. S3.2.2.5]
MYGRKDICSEGIHAIYFTSQSIMVTFIGLTVLRDPIDGGIYAAAWCVGCADAYRRGPAPYAVEVKDASGG